MSKYHSKKITQEYRFELVPDGWEPEEDKSCAFCEDAEDEEICEACAITYSLERGEANVMGETNDAEE